MLLLDKLFTWPATGLLWVVEELQQAAKEERQAEADGIRADLRDLYLQLESGGITEEVFDERECVLLDRLEAVEEALRQQALEDADDDDDDPDEDDDDEEDDEDEPAGAEGELK